MVAFNPSAPDSGPNNELIPKGPTIGRCSRVVELGLQESFYGNQYRVQIAFNLPNYTINIGGEEKQRMISVPFGINMSNNEASTMAQYTKALNPDATSLGDFLNQPAQITITHRERKKDNKLVEAIDNVAPLYPGVTVPELDIEPLWFQWDNPDPYVWSQLPDFTKDIIKEALNYKDSPVEEMVNKVEGDSEVNTEDLPFAP